MAGKMDEKIDFAQTCLDKGMSRQETVDTMVEKFKGSEGYYRTLVYILFRGGKYRTAPIAERFPKKVASKKKSVAKKATPTKKKAAAKKPTPQKKKKKVATTSSRKTTKKPKPAPRPEDELDDPFGEEGVLKV